MIGASKVSEMLGGDASRKLPETCDKRLEAAFSMVSLSSNHAPRVFEDL